MPGALAAAARLVIASVEQYAGMRTLFFQSRLIRKTSLSGAK
jgi:hypothetical protein